MRFSKLIASVLCIIISACSVKQDLAPRKTYRETPQKTSRSLRATKNVGIITEDKDLFIYTATLASMDFNKMQISTHNPLVHLFFTKHNFNRINELYSKGIRYFITDISADKSYNIAKQFPDATFFMINDEYSYNSQTPHNVIVAGNNVRNPIEALINHALEKGYKKFAILANDSSQGYLFKEACVNHLKNQNAKSPLIVIYRSDLSNLPSELHQLQEAPFDVILIDEKDERLIKIINAFSNIISPLTLDNQPKKILVAETVDKSIETHLKTTAEVIITEIDAAQGRNLNKFNNRLVNLTKQPHNITLKYASLYDTAMLTFMLPSPSKAKDNVAYIKQILSSAQEGFNGIQGNLYYKQSTQSIAPKITVIGLSNTNSQI